MGLRRLLVALLCGGALVFATPALAAPAAELPLPRDPSLWATINVCDTVGHPDGVGIRGSMPGGGDRRTTLHMRLQLQFLRSDGTWRSMGRGADSGWLALGRGDAKVRQAGRTFTLTPPGEGRPAFVLRGLATFEWRSGDGELMRRARRATSAGHPGTPGADPEDFSAATCSVR